MLLVFILIFASAVSYKPAPPVKCGVNEYVVPCKTVCPPQNCHKDYQQYKCDPKPKCIPGCDCIEDHLRNDEKICVYKEKCPGLFDNTTNVLPEPPDNYSGSNSSSIAIAQAAVGQSKSNASASSFSSTSNLSWSNQSSSSSRSSFLEVRLGGGGQKRDCTYNSCTPTCSLPYSENCPQGSNPCNCPPGTIISEEGGKCVQREECQKYANCKGDYNASYADCPFAYPSTCANPDAEYSNSNCGNSTCTCNPGYLLNEIDGNCIKPEDCPDGNVCGLNETFVDCLIKCPNIYCPISDNRDTLVCESENRCPSGCSCQKKFKRKSVDEYVCILASDCPPINCTRPNEEYHFCPDPCFSDYCSARNQVTESSDCPYSEQDCIPQCICIQGFFRNENNTCVTAQECPVGNFTLIDKASQNLTPEDKEYANCKGDYNASYADCPFAYPSTCANPDAEYSNSSCGDSTCTCNPGYLLNETDGNCIKPEDCPDGNVCGLNETFVDCLIKCPNIYCPISDNRDTLVCESENRCPSGCSCQKKFKRKSVDEYVCILASDCPPVNCTRPNEEYHFCPDPCFSDYCSARNKVTKPGDCPYSEQDCIPQCICKQGFFRNGNNTCVTAQECPAGNFTLIDKASLNLTLEDKGS